MVLANAPTAENGSAVTAGEGETGNGGSVRRGNQTPQVAVAGVASHRRRRLRLVRDRAAAGVLLFLFLLLSLIVLATALGGAARAGVATGVGIPATSPLNASFVEAMRALSVGRQETLLIDGGVRRIGGYIPSPLQEPLPSFPAAPSGGRVTALAYPTSYDLRSLGRVPPVRDQGARGTCWSFASYGALESALLPGESRDFSEDNMVNGTGYVGVGYDTGGWYETALAYLARWGGPVDEASDPYQTPGILNLPAVKHLQSALRYPPRRSALDNDAIKNAVMTVGGVGVSMRWGGAYYSPGTTAYYYNGNLASNHAVVIVGWNDTYSRSSFGGAAGAPAGDGAFIVRNSWGTGFGEGGYFYVSYYDTRLAKSSSWAFPAPEVTTNYTDVYQYDPLGWTSSLGFSSTTAWFANGFTARADASVTAVAFYAATSGSSYEVRGGPSLSTLQPLSSGTFSGAGYHTVTLASPLSIAGNTQFYIAVRLSTPGYSYPVPLERPIQGWAEPVASPGQSFVSSTGATWSDLTTIYPNTNACLKAFTTGGTAPAATTKLAVTTPNGGETWPLSSSQTIRWTSTGLAATGYVKIELSRNGGNTWITLISATPNDGTHPWVVNGAGSTQARIRITSTSKPGVSDTSDANFTLAASATLTVTTPNGGETWPLGSAQIIRWTSTGLAATSYVKIELSRNGGSTWSTLISATPNDGSHTWTIPGAGTTQARLRITSTSRPAATDTSDANFALSLS